MVHYVASKEGPLKTALETMVHTSQCGGPDTGWKRFWLTLLLPWKPHFSDSLPVLLCFLYPSNCLSFASAWVLWYTGVWAIYCGSNVGEVLKVIWMNCCLQVKQQVLAGRCPQKSCDDFLKQMGYREYSRYISYHFPFTHERALLEHVQACPWNYDRDHFKVWKVIRVCEEVVESVSQSHVLPIITLIHSGSQSLDSNEQEMLQERPSWTSLSWENWWVANIKMKKLLAVTHPQRMRSIVGTSSPGFYTTHKVKCLAQPTL